MSEDLRCYYEKLFPVETFCRWLSPGKSDLMKRELSFTLPGDIYCRYQSFADHKEFGNALIDRIPDKIDIGAIFSGCPKHFHQFGVVASSGGVFRPIERELVFDIDMDEYDTVRTCCKGANVCEKCWTFIAAAVRVLHEALVEDFAFSKIMFAFSGRRGVHCWVSDKAARLLSNEERSAVAEYLQIVQGAGKANSLRRRGALNHPLVKRSSAICEKYFEKSILGIVEGQDLGKQEDGVFSKIIAQLDDNIKSHILNGKPGSREIWARLKDYLKSTKRKEGLPTVEEVILENTYPRLDINVSKQLNHLLKAPFCIHPKTGKVCVPIMDTLHPETFNPHDVPTLSNIVKAQREGKTTTLEPYLAWFNQFVNSIEAEERDTSDMTF